MANTKRTLATALAVSATLLTAGLATAADGDARTIVLHVDDYAGLPPADWTMAKDIVTRIYAAAGVRTIWAPADDEAADIESTLHLKVLILSPEMGERKIAADGVPNGVLGQAARISGRAYIFQHRLARVAAGYGRPAGMVLGNVVAHEIGHLVLPMNAHSKTGVMCANLDMQGEAAPRFTDEQTAAIRTVLNAAN